MIAVSIAAKTEWAATLAYFGVSAEDCTSYPFGVYFQTEIAGKVVIVCFCGNSKVPHRAVQCDCTVRELKLLIRLDFVVDIDLSPYGGGEISQGQMYVQNAPKVMEKIFDAYLEKFL